MGKNLRYSRPTLCMIRVATKMQCASGSNASVNNKCSAGGDAADEEDCHLGDAPGADSWSFWPDSNCYIGNAAGQDCMSGGGGGLARLRSWQ